MHFSSFLKNTKNFRFLFTLLTFWIFWPRACEARPTSNEVDHYHHYHYHHHHHHLHCHRSFWKFFVISLNDDVIHHACNMIRQDSKSEKYFLSGWKLENILKMIKTCYKIESKLFLRKHIHNSWIERLSLSNRI